MKKVILFFLTCLLFMGMGHGFAAESAVPLLQVKVLQDDETRQRGAKWFMNYCAGCHSLQYMRYARLGKDLNIIDRKGALDVALLRDNLMFSTDDIYSPMMSSIDPVASAKWFGKVPPDLSLVMRYRGADWVYTYLKSFYQDSSKPFRSNNLLFPNVMMPNVLAPLRGEVILRKGELTHDNLLLIKQGNMTPQEFDSMLVDVVSFLDYVSEPNKEARWAKGKWVIGFLLIFFVVLVLLKKIYWRRIHCTMK